MEKISPELEDFIENEEADKFNSKITRVVKTVLNTFAGILITSYLASSSFCILREDISRSHLISALLLGSGTCILFTTFCFKKFTITGSNGLGYLVCLLMLFESQPCQGYGDIYAMGPELRASEWHRRLNELQGAVTTVCLVQLLVSFIDVRFLIKLIKPVSITPTLIFIGFFFMKTSAVRMAATSWTLFISTSGLMFALYLNTSNCSNSHDRKNHRILLLRNKLYIGIFCVVLMWCLCALLSSFELIWTRSAARTDIYTGIYDYASKITIPFPFQWGVPKWKNESIYLMLPAAFITIFEILANFYKKYGSGNANAANALSNVNMLIRLEAIFCFVMSTTGVVIGLNVNAKKNCTKVLDIVSALILLMMAISGFLCAFFTTIPVPIMAALIFLLFSSAVLEGFDMLRFVDLRSVKNIFTLSTSFFMAFAIPTLIREDLEITRRPAVDHVLRCLLSTEFIVAGLTAILFDNLFAAFMGESATNDYGKISKCNSSNQEASNSSEGRESSEFCDCFSPFFA